MRARSLGDRLFRQRDRFFRRLRRPDVSERDSDNHLLIVISATRFVRLSDSRAIRM